VLVSRAMPAADERMADNKKAKKKADIIKKGKKDQTRKPSITRRKNGKNKTKEQQERSWQCREGGPAESVQPKRNLPGPNWAGHSDSIPQKKTKLAQT